MGLRDEHGAPRSVPAKAENPDLTDAAAFAKIFSAQDEAGIMLRKAYNVVKNAAYPADQDDSAEAIPSYRLSASGGGLGSLRTNSSRGRPREPRAQAAGADESFPFPKF